MQTPNTEALKSAVRNIPYRLLVLGCSAAAICSLAMNYSDNRAVVSYTQVCFQPSNTKVLKRAKKKGIQYCTADKRFWISDPILSNWERTEPEFYNKLTRLKTLPVQTKNKGIYGAVSVICGLGVAGLGAARLTLINKLAPGYRKEVQAQWHRDAVKSGVQMASDAIDGRMSVLNKQYRGEIDLARRQSAYLTPEEIHAQVQQSELIQAQQQAYLEGQQQAELVQPQQAQITGQSMEEVANPGDKIQSGTKQSQIPQSWTNNLVKQTALIWGNQGGGKSWLARYVAASKLKAGYKVIVLDPDSNPSEWQGVESYHSWKDIETQINWYVEELQSRLTEFNNSSMNDEQWQAKLLADGRATALIVEEATTYSTLIKNDELLETFGKLALTKSRKQLMPITVVAHNNTQECLFGIKSLSNLVKKMLQVECLAEVNRETLKPQSTGQAKVKLDSSNEWLIVSLPVMKSKITNFSNIGSNSQPATKSQPVDTNKAEDEKLKAIRDIISDCWTKDDSELSDNAQKLITWIRRKVDEGKTQFTVEMCRSSGCVGGAKSPNIKQLLDELVQANILVLKDGGVYELR